VLRPIDGDRSVVRTTSEVQLVNSRRGAISTHRLGEFLLNSALGVSRVLSQLLGIRVCLENIEFHESRVLNDGSSAESSLLRSERLGRKLSTVVGVLHVFVREGSRVAIRVRYQVFIVSLRRTGRQG